MHVTLHHAINNPTVLGQLWQLYTSAFEDTATEAVSRQSLFREEFDEAISSPLTRLWIVWRGVQPVAMAAVDTDVSQSAWVNEAFLARRFPEHHARKAIHYCLFLLVHPDHRMSRALPLLARTALRAESDGDVVLVFDCSEARQPRDGFGLADFIGRMAETVSPGAMVHMLEVHQYYAVVLSGGDRRNADREVVAG